MSNISDIEEARRQRRRAKAKKKAAIWLAIGLCVLVLFSARRLFTVDHIAMVARDTLSGFQSGRLPIDLSEGVPEAIETDGSGIAVVTSTSVIGYNKNGAMVQNEPHSFSDPGIAADGRYKLVFNRGNLSCSLMSHTTKLYDKNISHKILDGDVNRGGQVALATTSDRYLSQVSVYDILGKEIFTWYSSTDYVLNVDFDGKYLAVSAARIEDSKPYGVLYLLKINRDKEQFCITYEGEVPLHTEVSGGSVAVYTDKGYYCYNKAGKLQGSYPFENSSLIHVDPRSDSKICMTLGSGTALNRVVLADRKGKPIIEIEPEDAVLGAHYYGGKIAVLFSDRLVIYDKNAEIVDTVDFTKTCQHLYAEKNHLYIQVSDSIIKHTM